MTYRIGIGKQRTDGILAINFLLYNRMLKIDLFVKCLKKPKYYYWNKRDYEYCEKIGIIAFKWFFGLNIEVVK